MSLQACAEITRRGDPERFLAAMAAPPAARAVLFPLYAFNVEVARAPWVTREPALAGIRLQWWHDVLEEIATGAPVSPHEVSVPLAGVLDGPGARALQGLVAARRHDIEGAPFADSAELLHYLEQTGGTLMWVAARALGCRQGEEAVRAVGRAAALASWFRAVPALEARARRPLPDARAPALAGLARAELARLRAARREVPAPARPATRAGWLAGWVLRRAAARPERIRAGGLEPSDFVKRGSLLWRTLAGRG